MTAQVSEFGRVLSKAEKGDHAALDELIHTYGEHIRRVARRRIKELGIQDEVEADDLFDSVVRLMLARPDQIEQLDVLSLVKLIKEMTRAKAISVYRKKHAQKRGGAARRIALEMVEQDKPDEGGTVDLEQTEATQAAWASLSAEDKRLVEMRKSGLSWREVADQLRSTPNALRMRFSRIVRRAIDKFNGGGD